MIEVDRIIKVLLSDKFIEFDILKLTSASTYAQLVEFGVWLDIERLPCCENFLFVFHKEPYLPINNCKG